MAELILSEAHDGPRNKLEIEKQNANQLIPNGSCRPSSGRDELVQRCHMVVSHCKIVYRFVLDWKQILRYF